MSCFGHGLETALHRTPRRRTAGHGGGSRAHERPALPRARQDAAQGAAGRIDAVAAGTPGWGPSAGRARAVQPFLRGNRPPAATERDGAQGPLAVGAHARDLPPGAPEVNPTT